jgi:glycosyltransferase involved in cell wall biosynthesis
MTHKFSIVIPAHNRREYLRQAVASCLKQTVSEFEVIVSDDCSTDDLRSVTDAFSDPRVKYHRSERRLGAATNHQCAVSLSSGVYAIVLHSDDLLLPGCLETAGAALDRNPTAAAVYFSSIHLSGSKLTGSSLMPTLHFANGKTFRENPWLEKFSGVNPSCCLFRRTAFDLIGGYRTSLRFAYDWEIYRRFMDKGGGVIFLPQALTIYRHHDEQAIRTSTLDGLRDILDLWSIKEYSHFPAWKISELILTQAGTAVRKGDSLSNLIKEITARHLTRRVLPGLPRAFYEKIRRRLFNIDVGVDSNYERPLNLDSALRSATDVLHGLVDKDGMFERAAD